MYPHEAFDLTLKTFKIKAVDVAHKSGKAESYISQFRHGTKDIAASALVEIIRALPMLFSAILLGFVHVQRWHHLKACKRSISDRRIFFLSSPAFYRRQYTVSQSGGVVQRTPAMKYVRLLVSALSFSVLLLASPAIADTASGYIHSIFRNTEQMCKNIEDEVHKCSTITTRAKIKFISTELEREKDNGCLMEREILEWGYSKLPLSEECKQRLAAWDKEHPEDRAADLKLLESLQGLQFGTKIYKP